MKYESYQPSPAGASGDFFYYDVLGRRHAAELNPAVPRHDYFWPSEIFGPPLSYASGKGGVPEVTAPAGYRMLRGIDVSRHNGPVDWSRVKAAGYDFAFIRIAYRGYGTAGSLREDERALSNLTAAKSAGLKVGVYVFSQAVNEAEAVEEAAFVTDLLGKAAAALPGAEAAGADAAAPGRKSSVSDAAAPDGKFPLDLPVIFDPETIRDDIARTDNVTGEQFTANAAAFCEYIEKGGYEPGIYSNMIWEDYYFDLSQLTEYPIWYADYSSRPQTPYHFTWWQYSEKGTADGVSGPVDLNVWFVKE
ncbi:MAG: lysozyme [Clostridium sp.]|nr:lysozyme [Clostridium sp.]